MIDFENEKLPTETKSLNGINLERTVDGNILQINDVVVDPTDRIFVVQRHQRPTSFSKQDLIGTSGIKTHPTNKDYKYDPAATSEGDERERTLLDNIKGAFGNFDAIGTTPLKRGAEQAALLREAFPEAMQSESISRGLDDSDFGLVGESKFAGNDYTLEETQRMFRPSAGEGGEWKFEGTPFMKTWVDLSYRGDHSQYGVESPEELAERTRSMLEKGDAQKSYFITHESNCIVLHMMAERSPEEIKGVMSKIKLPEDTLSELDARLGTFDSYLDFYTAARELLLKDPKKKLQNRQIVADILEAMELKSGENNSGYGAVSVYIQRKDENDRIRLIEAAYDTQPADEETDGTN